MDIYNLCQAELQGRFLLHEKLVAVCKFFPSPCFMPPLLVRMMNQICIEIFRLSNHFLTDPCRFSKLLVFTFKFHLGHDQQVT
jgi:hypothetical protein